MINKTWSIQTFTTQKTVGDSSAGLTNQGLLYQARRKRCDRDHQKWAFTPPPTSLKSWCFSSIPNLKLPGHRSTWVWPEEGKGERQWFHNSKMTWLWMIYNQPTKHLSLEKEGNRLRLTLSVCLLPFPQEKSLATHVFLYLNYFWAGHGDAWRYSQTKGSKVQGYLQLYSKPQVQSGLYEIHLKNK